MKNFMKFLWNSVIIFGFSDSKNLRILIPIKSEWYQIKSRSGIAKRLRLWQALVMTKNTLINVVMNFCYQYFCFEIFFFQNIFFEIFFQIFFSIFFPPFFSKCFFFDSFTLDASPFTKTKRTIYVSVFWKIWYAASGRNWTLEIGTMYTRVKIGESLAGSDA